MEIGQTLLPSIGFGYDSWGNPLKNNGGLFHNACEVSLSQPETSVNLLSSVTVIFDGIPLELPHIGTVGGRDVFQFGGDTIMYSGGNWIVSLSSGTSVSVESGQYPPKTLWPDIAGLTISVDYESNWIDSSGYPIRRFHPDFVAATNLLNGEAIKWSKMTGRVCGAVENAQFKQGAYDDISPSQKNEVIRWTGDGTCGAGALV